VPYHGEKYMEIDNDSVSEFERNHDIDSFVFETPFTRDSIGISSGGQSQSGPREQWKRQTILRSNYIQNLFMKYFKDFSEPVKSFT